MNVLVVGGAGYIGSHAVRRLMQREHTVWVYDNCSLGHAAAVPASILLKGDLRDQELLTEILQEKQIEAVMHFAAFASVPESLAEPAKYYDNNVIGTLRLLEAMRAAEVWRIVFSSTCATYGIPEKPIISEDTPQRPINPYGFTKLTIEQALEAYAQAYGFGYAAFRYFNAAGASPEGDMGEDPGVVVAAGDQGRGGRAAARQQDIAAMHPDAVAFDGRRRRGHGLALGDCLFGRSRRGVLEEDFLGRHAAAEDETVEAFSGGLLSARVLLRV